MPDVRKQTGRIGAENRSSARFLARVLAGARPHPIPGFIEACRPTSRTNVPTGDQWVHEIKFDGHRLQAHLQEGRRILFGRNGEDWTKRFSRIAAALQHLPVNRIVLDGEVIVQDGAGRSDFAALEKDLEAGRQDRLVFFAFDLLHLDGFDIRDAPLVDRKRVLAALLEESGEGPIVYSEHMEIDGGEMLEQVRQMGLQGIISKRRDSPYRSGRQRSWVRTNCTEPAS